MQRLQTMDWRIKIDFMKKRYTIHNLDTLEKEIYRLKLELRLKEVTLTDNWEKLLSDFPEILTNSLLCRNSEKLNGKETFGQRFFNNEKGFQRELLRNLMNYLKRYFINKDRLSDQLAK